MNINKIKDEANIFLQKQDILQNEEKDRFLALYKTIIILLENGSLRVAEKINNVWKVNFWLKEIILLGFKYGSLVEIFYDNFNYYDKDTVLPRKLNLSNKIRIVPQGSTIRSGSYVASKTIIMPPSYINIGAYIDTGCMVDSHVLIGSCAQIGKNVHISAASQIGGVLEPIGSSPIIIEDNVFIGGNCGLYEGVIVKEGAIIGSGVILNGSTPIFDNVNNIFIKKDNLNNLIVPNNAVVIPGSRPINHGYGIENKIHIYCPVIIKYKDKKTQQSIILEKKLR